MGHRKQLAIKDFNWAVGLWATFGNRQVKPKFGAHINIVTVPGVVTGDPNSGATGNTGDHNQT